MMDPRTSAQDVIRCHLCRTAVVEMHCDTCLVNLCKACMGEHFSADLSKPHKIVDFKDRKSGPLYPKCKSHNKEPCEMYCKQCDIPVCINCLDSNQHLGHEVSNILRVLRENKDRIIKEKKDEYGFSMETTNKSLEAGSSPPVKQLLDQPKTVTTINTGYNYLYYVACLSDEEIWTSGLDKTMKLYSINQGSLLKSIRTKSGNTPSDIKVTKKGDLVYTNYNNRTVNIVKNEKIEEVIRLQKWIPLGVCSTSSDDLLVIMNSDGDKQSKVVRYSGSTVKQVFQFDDKCKRLYLSGRFITENKNLDICVSDQGANAVVVVSQDGKLRFRYTGHTPALKVEQFNPVGITTDNQRNILTTDYYNDCVHIIDQDGHFLRYIDCGLSQPLGLCTDTNDNLFVAQYRKRQVKKIKYMQ